MSNTLSKEGAGGGERFCRICANAEQADDSLVSPCECRGTIRFVHRACLKESIQITRKLSCTICRQNFRGITIGVRLPGKLRFTRCNLPKVLYHVFLLVALIMNDAFILHRAGGFYLKRLNHIERKLVRFGEAQRKQAELGGQVSPIAQAIEPVSSAREPDQKDSENLKAQPFKSGILLYLRRSIGRLFRSILRTLIKTVKYLSDSDQNKFVFVVRSVLLTALYLINDLVQFAVAFVFIWYVCRCLQDSFIIWSAKNAELLVDFTTDPAY